MSYVWASVFFFVKLEFKGVKHLEQEALLLAGKGLGMPILVTSLHLTFFASYAYFLQSSTKELRELFHKHSAYKSPHWGLGSLSQWSPFPLALPRICSLFLIANIIF